MRPPPPRRACRCLFWYPLAVAALRRLSWRPIAARRRRSHLGSAPLIAHDPKRTRSMYVHIIIAGSSLCGGPWRTLSSLPFVLKGPRPNRHRPTKLSDESPSDWQACMFPPPLPQEGPAELGAAEPLPIGSLPVPAPTPAGGASRAGGRGTVVGMQRGRGVSPYKIPNK